MKNLKLKLLGFSSIGTIVLTEVFRAAIGMTGYDYNVPAFATVRALGLLAVDAFVFFIFAYLTSRIINDKEVPSALRNKRIQTVFITVGVILSAIDAVRDALIDPANINASASVVWMFFLWLAVCSFSSLGEVSGQKRTGRILRAILCLLVAAVAIFLYTLFWISAIYKFLV
jgi:hypothetical protein